VRHQGKLVSERAAAETRLADVLQRESALEASWAMEKESGEQQLPAFTTASQNVAAVVTCLNVLLATPANDGGKVCQ
jgi:hypothetical protein